MKTSEKAQRVIDVMRRYASEALDAKVRAQCDLGKVQTAQRIEKEIREKENELGLGPNLKTDNSYYEEAVKKAQARFEEAKETYEFAIEVFIGMIPDEKT